ncbi:NfeD family protein [Asticcacaulis sp. AND118]|uniref:NfeD family protein n=1 Tax=Asticcacaulis sp. AND118 TaxID=2840468 RepID=UPI001CFF7505|nr:NfeD family protein [Asticcacaulis sp. AND118]UDF02200.1 NfeD family protein [Asticcacaulis sp. AND118]
MVEFLLAQPQGPQLFWVWLSIGGALLALEMVVGTQWLLWPAAAAGIVSVITLTGAPANLLVQIVVFCVLTLAMTLLSRRFLKPPLVEGADINDPQGRLIGQEATVIEAFDDPEGQQSRGRVILDGVEWPARSERGDAPIGIAEKVRILAVAEGKLIVARV